jgi:hypothetical protein
MSDARQTFVARSEIRSVVRVEMQKLLDNVLAPAVGQVVAELRREFDADLRDAAAAKDARAGRDAEPPARRVTRTTRSRRQ